MQMEEKLKLERQVRYMYNYHGSLYINGTQYSINKNSE